MGRLNRLFDSFTQEDPLKPENRDQRQSKANNSRKRRPQYQPFQPCSSHGMRRMMFLAPTNSGESLRTSLLAQKLHYATIETLAQGERDTTAHIWAVSVLQDGALYQVETANGWAIETVPFMTGWWRDTVAEPPPTIKHLLAQRSHLLIRVRGRDRFYFRLSAALRMDPRSKSDRSLRRVLACSRPRRMHKERSK
jgi:hypothetical protein